MHSDADFNSWVMSRTVRQEYARMPRYLTLVALWSYLLFCIPPAVGAFEPLNQPGLFHASPHKSQLIQDHLNLGMQYAREGRLQEAIGHLKYCIGLDASFADAYYLLGLVYYHLGLSHIRETDYTMSKVLELQPGHLDARVYRGLTRMRLGAFEAAEQDFRTILTYAPDMVLVRRDLDSANLRQGNIE